MCYQIYPLRSMSKKPIFSASMKSITTASQTPPEEKEEIVGKSSTTYVPSQNCISTICQNKQSYEYNVCQGKDTSDNQSHFKRFVEAIIDFKMGRSKAVIEEILDKSCPPYTKEQSSYYGFSSAVQQPSNSEKHWENSCGNRASMPCNPSTKLQQKPAVHQGIQCDRCHQWPIIGIRYKCRQCEDYDLCSSCLVEGKHQHSNFRVLHQSKKELQKQKLKGSLQQGGNNDSIRFNSIIQRVGSKFSTLFS